MKSNAYIVVTRTADGPRVTDCATKREAHTLGMELRRAGADVAVYPAAEALRLGLDPRATP